MSAASTVGLWSARLAKASEPFRLGLTFTVWFIANVVINVYNKFILSRTGFHFPLTLTANNKLIGWIGAILVLRFSAQGQLPSLDSLLTQFKRPMVHAHGVITALNIGLNNWSLVMLSITINQLIKSVVPLPTAALSILLERKSYSWHVYASMLVLVLGTALASTAPNAEANLPGVLLCLGSVLCAAAWTVVSALLMQRGAEKLDSVSLIFVSSPTSILCLVVLSAILESRGLAGYFRGDGVRVDGDEHVDAHHDGGPGRWLEHSAAHAAESSSPHNIGLLYLLGGGLLGFSYDLIHNQFLKMTSAVTMAIMGNTKLVVLIAISMLTLEKPPNIMAILGVLVALGGVFWYTIHRHHEAQAKEAEARREREAAAASSSMPPTRAGEGTALLGGGASRSTC